MASIIGSINKKFLFISLLYDILGTFAICSAFPHDLFYGRWALWAAIFTLPINLLSFAYRFGESHIYWPVLCIQVIMIIPCYLLVQKLMTRN